MKNNRIDLVQFLIEEGENIHVVDGAGNNLLAIALSYNHLDMARMLVNSQYAPEFTTSNNFQLSPLHIACMKHGAEDIVIKLLHFMSPNIKSSNGYAPLHLAARVGNIPAIIALINYNADLNIPDEEFCAPLKEALRTNHVEAALKLLDAGATPNVLPGDSCDSPLMSAVAKDLEVVVTHLILKGAEINYMNSREASALLLNVTKPNETQESIRILKALLLGDAQTHAVRSDGETALHWYSS